MFVSRCLLVFILATGFWASARARQPVTCVRTPVSFPEVPGYVTLKCDFHMHTVFSDGDVWPSVRAEEAWRHGLDAFAITDHLEYLPHKADLSTNSNRATEIARAAGTALDLLVVGGAEISRKMPPGHLNAIFLTNAAVLVVDDWRAAVAIAQRQGAFIIWDHPGWDAQLTNGQTLWYPEHTELLERGCLHGIEIVNGRDYYPEAHRWAIEKGLGLFCNSDIHSPLEFEYNVHQGDHRPMTLVFAKERTAAALKEALFARQTAVYSGDKLIGDERFLRPIYSASVEVHVPKTSLKPGQRVQVQVHNRSDLDFRLERRSELAEVSFPKEMTLVAHRTVLLPVTGRSGMKGGNQKISLPYTATNLLIGPAQPLPVTIDFELQAK